MFRKRLSIIVILAFAFLACSTKKPLVVAKLKLDVKDDPYYQFIHADSLSMEGETQRSTAELLKLSEKYPEMAYFYYLLAENYVKEKRFPEAYGACKKAIEISPSFLDARILVGKLYALQDRHSDAAQTFAAVVHDDPKLENMYPLLANEYLAMRESTKAVETLKRMIAINPDSVSAYYFLGRIYEEHLQNNSEALKMYKEAINIDPGNLNVQNAMGELYIKQKQLKAALAKYEEISRMVPDEVAIQLRVALIHYELKDYDQAIVMFERILVKNPDADKIRFYLGVLYENTRKIEEAIAQFEKVPVNSSYFKDARIHVASLYRSMDRTDGAIGALKAAIAEKPQLPEFYEYLAAIYEERKEYQQSIDILEEGHAAIPGDEKISFLLGVVYEKVKDRDKAMAAMRDALKANPRNAGALNYIGYTLADRNEDLDEALKLIEQALILRPDDGYIMDSLGWASLKKGDMERALKYLTKANSLVPGEPTILYHMGEAALRNGDTRSAMKYLQKALDAGAKKKEVDGEEMEMIRKRLEELKGN